VLTEPQAQVQVLQPQVKADQVVAQPHYPVRVLTLMVVQAAHMAVVVVVQLGVVVAT
jgi:hypothetical protein